MNRKQYMDSLNAQCTNHQFSWSFVNHSDKIVYFGAWQHKMLGDGRQHIFSLSWQFKNGRRSNGFSQSCGHLDLILSSGYRLFTFTQVARLKNGGGGPTDESPKIHYIIENACEMRLCSEGEEYFACPLHLNANVETIERKYLEGALVKTSQTLRERNPDARKACLEHFGFKCRVCDFDFENKYGSTGMHYIHVHHLELLARQEGEHEVFPHEDLRPVCPNCHAMIHRREKPYSINDVRAMMRLPPLENP